MLRGRQDWPQRGAMWEIHALYLQVTHHKYLWKGGRGREVGGGRKENGGQEGRGRKEEKMEKEKGWRKESGEK